MRVGVFPKPPPEVVKSLAKNDGPVEVVVTRYCFDAVGRKIAMQGVEIGAILQVRVLLDYRDPKTGETGRRCYAVVQVYPEQERFVREVLGLAEASENGILDLSEKPTR